MKNIFLLALLLLPLTGNAQSAQRWYTALLPNLQQGNNYVAVIPNASVYVCVDNEDTQCDTPIGIYSNSELDNPIIQPLLADGNGVYSYYIQAGTKVVEKVCAPYDQCSSYRLKIGDDGSGGGGSGTVTDVICDNLHPLFGCSVSTSTTTPEIVFTLDTAQADGFWGNVQATTGAPSYVTLIAGNNITFTRDRASTPNTLTINASGGGGGGCTGTDPSDNTSTDCGYQNRVGDTTTPPANVSTFGYTLLANNAATQVVAIGNQDGAGLTHFAGEVVAIGDQNNMFVGSDAGDNVSIGDQNYVGTSDNPCHLANTVAVGLFNINPCPTGARDSNSGDIVAIGDDNFNTQLASNALIRLGSIVTLGFDNFIASPSANELGVVAAVCIGQDTCINLTNSLNTDLVAIGDGSLNGVTSNGANTFPFVDVVGIGDASAIDLPNHTYEVVAIGSVSGAGCGNRTGCTPGTSTMGDIVAIGDSSGVGLNGTDVVAIGDSNLEGDANHFFAGNNIIAIGNHSCAADTTGSDNVCIGDFAGSIGFDDGSGIIGNANLTGSHNVWIGDNAGPGTTDQLDDTVAIGFGAQNTQSDQVILGGPSVTQMCFANGGICWYKGTGVPSSGLCTSSNIGSLYSNTSGGVSTTLYVCTAAATWTAK